MILIILFYTINTYHSNPSFSSKCEANRIITIFIDVYDIAIYYRIYDVWGYCDDRLESDDVGCDWGDGMENRGLGYIYVLIGYEGERLGYE